MSEKRPRLWLRLLVTVLAVVAGLAALGAAFALPRLDAVNSLVAFGAEVPGEDGVLLPGQELLEDEPRLGFQRVVIQRPASAGPHPVLVFVHGVASLGLDDARILQAVDAFACGGFVVVAPEVPLLVRPPHADRDEARLARLLDTIAAGDVEGVNPYRIGLLGVSVGGALALRAAATWCEQGGVGLRAVLAIGSPDDLRTLSATWFSLPREDRNAPRTFEEQRRHEAQFARNVIFRAALGRRVEHVEDRVRLREWMEGDMNAEVPPTDLETDAARQYAALVASGPTEWTRAHRSVLADALPLMRAFSPAQAEQRMKRLAGVTCFLLHGLGDSLVPPGEYKRLKARLARYTICIGLESHMIGHVDVEAVGLLERLDHVIFMDDFFDAVSR